MDDKLPYAIYFISKKYVQSWIELHYDGKRAPNSIRFLE